MSVKPDRRSYSSGPLVTTSTCMLLHFVSSWRQISKGFSGDF